MCVLTTLTVVIFIHIYLCEAKSTLPSGSNCTVKDHLPCTQYSFTDVTECNPANLAQLFPDLYGEEHWPGEAYSFDLVSIEQKVFNGVVYNYADVSVAFQPPHNVGVMSVRGFELTIYKANADRPTCIILDLSNASWTGDLDDMRTKFGVTFVAHPQTLYRLELYSLPRPQLDYPDMDKYQHLTILTPDYTKPSAASIYWKTFVDERRVAVTFLYPSTAPAFTQFELTLHSCACDQHGCTCDDSTWKNSQRVNSHEKFYNFTDVQPGNYSIWVKPIDPYFTRGDVSLCLCKKDAVCQQCPTTETVPFEFEYVVDATTTTAETTTETGPDLPEPGGTSPSGPTSSNLAVVPTQVPGDVSEIKIIVSVLGGVLGLALAGVGFWFYYLRYMKPRGHDKGVAGMQVNQGFHDDNDNGSMLTIDKMKTEKLTKLPNNETKTQVFEKVPKLFILYEEDHDFHCGVVNSFASYLHHSCQCQVMCASWQQEASWVHQEMQQADYVVIVNSEAAYNIYKSRKSDNAGSTRVVSINSVLEQFLQDARYDNIIMVYFDHTAERFVLPDICPGYNYKLMKHFTDFLIHVHQLRRTDNLAQYDLPFDGNHGHRGEIGQQLIESMNRCKKYEQENPKWFVRKYGMMRLCSNTSEQSQQDSGLEEMMPSLPETPTRDQERPELLKYVLQLDCVSQGAVTINPPPPSPLPDAHHPGDSPPTTAESGQFEFLPPDDFTEADIMSKSESEQMKSIVDRYHWNCGMPSDRTAVGHGYDRDHDLALLRIQSGELPFTIDLTEPGDVHSLGGESV